MFSNLGSMTNFQNFNFFSTPLQRGGVKKIDFFLLQNFGFWSIRKVKNFKLIYKCVLDQLPIPVWSSDQVYEEELSEELCWQEYHHMGRKILNWNQD